MTQMTQAARQPVQGLNASQVHELLGRSSDDLPFDLAERVPQILQVDVITTDLSGAGYLMTVGSHAVIVAAKTGSWFRQNFTIAHELGHLACGTLCDEHLATDSESEARANRFAADLLMPEVEVRSLDWPTIDLSVLAERLWEWGTSTNALATRLSSLHISPRDDVRDALSWSTQRVLRRYLKGMPGRDLITVRMARATERRFPTELVTRLEDAVVSGRAPVESLAFALGVSPDQLDVDGPDLEDLSSDLQLLDGLE